MYWDPYTKMMAFSVFVYLNVNAKIIADGKEHGNDVISFLIDRMEKDGRMYLQEIRKLGARIEKLELIITQAGIQVDHDNEETGHPSEKISQEHWMGEGQEQVQRIQMVDDTEGPQTAVLTDRAASGVRRGHAVRQSLSLKPAFFATLTDHMFNMTYNQSITFDSIITNIGGAYNPASGIFTAPVAGSYVFSTSLMTYDTHAGHYIIAKNGVAQSYMYIRGNESPAQTTSQTATLDLQAGDGVEIMCIDYNKNLNGYGYSTFTGFLLERINHEPVEIVG